MTEKSKNNKKARKLIARTEKRMRGGLPYLVCGNCGTTGYINRKTGMMGLTCGCLAGVVVTFGTGYTDGKNKNNDVIPMPRSGVPMGVLKNFYGGE